MSGSGDPEDFEPQYLMTHNVADTIFYFVLCVAWVAGFVIAKGFWSTFACLFPLWAWYLVVEKLLQSIGWV